MRSKCNDDELFDGQMRVRACAKWIATPKATDRSRNLLLQHDNGVGARQQPFRRRFRTNPKETDQTKNLAVRRETQTDGAAVCVLPRSHSRALCIEAASSPADLPREGNRKPPSWIPRTLHLTPLEVAAIGHGGRRRRGNSRQFR